MGRRPSLALAAGWAISRNKVSNALESPDRRLRYLFVAQRCCGVSDQELVLILDAALAELSRPHRCDEPITPIVRDALRQLGLVSDESTPRADLIAQIWARKRQAALVGAART
jgi:hypothetical protein